MPSRRCFEFFRIGVNNKQRGEGDETTRRNMKCVCDSEQWRSREKLAAECEKNKSSWFRLRTFLFRPRVLLLLRPFTAFHARCVFCFHHFAAASTNQDQFFILSLLPFAFDDLLLFTSLFPLLPVEIKSMLLQFPFYYCQQPFTRIGRAFRSSFLTALP